MKKPIISGIQQIGVGNPDVYGTFKWYRRNFGMDIPIFDEAAEAGLMLPYTEGEPRQRHAILAINLQGGGGLEIWQYTSRTSSPATFDIQLGDYGIYVCRFKSKDIRSTYDWFKSKNVKVLGGIGKTPEGKEHFYVEDPYGNICEVAPGEGWFQSGKHYCGGVSGCTIGVSNIENARKVYSGILGYDVVVYDETAVFEDLKALPSGDEQFRRVLLRHSQPRQGAFSKMFGPTEIELIEAKDRQPNKIFKDRMWGDIGFIHLCFDISGMKEMQALCSEKGFPFTVDSSTAFNEGFDMGEAAGHFSYIEDPDGTLIEFVETHKLPIMKKLNWYLDLRKRDASKPLPKWMLKSLAFNRVKD